MNANVDEFVRIGSSHDICQDHALTGQLESDRNVYSWGILSDGCSTAKNSETGAMILCRCANNMLRDYILNGSTLNGYLGNKSLFKNLSTSIYYSAINVVDLLKMDRECLCCTLWIVLNKIDKVESEHQTVVVGWGDGVVVQRFDCGERGDIVKCYSVSYDGNMPYYLLYEFDRLRKEQFKLFEQNCNVATYSDVWSGSNVETEFNPIIFSDVRRGRAGTFVFSDGFVSFPGKQGVMELGKEFSDIKNSKGVFLKRRMKRALKDLAKKDVVNYDDLSCVAIYVDK